MSMKARIVGEENMAALHSMIGDQLRLQEFQNLGLPFRIRLFQMLFAAGHSPNKATIRVTRGTLQWLTDRELGAFWGD